MRILGVESSCDETGAAIIETTDHSIHMLSNVVASSMNLHAQTGGIIPEIAAREQIKFILPVIQEALQIAERKKQKEKSNNVVPLTLRIKPEIDALAVTVGPGLIGSLLVGVETTKTLSLLWNLPIIPVNHLLGHIYANFIDNGRNITFPAISLIVSGGHTDLLLLENHTKFTWIAGTRDDAAGEAFDKIGRLLGLPYPAGPLIEKLANGGNPKRFRFPRPLFAESTYDFSFSGLKTAVLREVQKLEKETKRIDEQAIKDLAFATQDAILDVLTTKTIKAAKEYDVTSILLGGGVAANETLKNRFTKMLHNLETGIKLFIPQKNLCTDNAAMIAMAAYFNQNLTSWEKISANPDLYFD